MSNKKGYVVIAMSAMLAVTLAACGGPSAGGSIPTMGSQEQSVLTVEIENPRIGSIYLDSKVIGTVEPAVQSEVLPKSTGTVKQVNFAVGDRVSQGQVLVVLDSDNINSAQINIQSAELQLATAQRSLDRTQELYDVGAESLLSLENAQNSVTSAQLQLATAQDNYNTLMKNVQQLKIGTHRG